MKYPILFHYTNIKGLIGILSKLELWSSDCRFLNDGREIIYARDIFFNEVEKLNLPPLELGASYLIPNLGLELYRIFVTCFCEKGDLLSQWRGYGKEQGYAIGFDFNLYEDNDKFEISKIQYGINNPKEFFSEELERAPQISAHPGVTDYHVSEMMLPRFAQVKHPSFVEEQEWRLIFQIPEYEFRNKENAFFRESHLGPIPMIINSIPKKCIKKVIIGPGPYSDICKQSVQSLLMIQEFLNVKVELSSIPFRK